MTLLRIAMREQRRGLIGFAGLGMILLVMQGAAFSQVAGSTQAARRAFAVEETALAKQFSWLYPDPVRIDTLAGYLQWHVFSIMVIILAIWAVFLGAAAVRRGEARGLVDQWLSAGVHRRRYIAVRALTGAGVLGAVVVLTCLGAVVGAAAGGNGLDAASLAGLGLSLWLTTTVCFAFALLLSQLLGGRRSAVGVSAAAVVGLLLVNGFARQLDGLRPVRVISPFHWYEQASPLAPGAGYDGVAILVLALAAVALVGLAAMAFAVRDVGAGLLRLPARRHSRETAGARNPLLRVPVASAVFRERWALVAWSAGIAVGALFLVGAAKPAAEIFDSNAQLRAFLPAFAHGRSTVQVYIGFAWFGLAALITVAFAITDVARWIADDVEGRLAMEISAPVSRTRVVVEHLGDLAVELCLLAAVNAAAVLTSAAMFGVSLDAGDVVIAAALLVPLGLAFGAVGGLLASWRPRLAVTLLSAAAVTSYLIFALGPLFKWPAWALDLSAFQLYGTPLVEGLFATGLVILLTVTAAGLAASLVTFARREIGA